MHTGTSGSAPKAAGSTSHAPTAPSSRCSGTTRAIPRACRRTPSMRSPSMRATASGSRPTAADSRWCRDPSRRPMPSASRCSPARRASRATPCTGWWRTPPAGSGSAGMRGSRATTPRATASRPTIASTACRARNSTPAPTIGCATGASPSAGPADSTSSTPRASPRTACRRTWRSRASRCSARRRRDRSLIGSSSASTSATAPTSCRSTSARSTSPPRSAIASPTA